MFALQFISGELFPLKRSDTAEAALMFMSDWKVKELPVVEGGRVLGFVTEKMLLSDPEMRVDQLMQTESAAYIAHVHTHLFELQEKLANHHFSTLTLEDEQNVFAGIINSSDILNQTTLHSALVQEGSVLVLEMPAIQYSLADISRICESNDTKIIQLVLERMTDEANSVRVSMKLNRKFLSLVIASLERFGYAVIYTNSPTESHQTLEDRFRWLVKYLNT